MIRFSKYIWLYAMLSALIIVPGIISLVRFGLKPSIDFTGGVLLEARLNNDEPLSTVEERVKEANIEAVSIQKTGNATYLFRLKPTDETSLTALENSLSSSSDTTLEVLRRDVVGPVLGGELLTKAIIASLFAIIAILSYVAYAFRNIRFGLSAVAALLHDMLVMFGSFSLLGYFFGVEVDTLFVTAVLTTMSFSVHDTIVIFDRIREYRKRDSTVSMEDISDAALTETMGRSLINSFTILFMLLALVLMGGETIRWFAMALLIGTITGTYSSPFVATPILILWSRIRKSSK